MTEVSVAIEGASLPCACFVVFFFEEVVVFRVGLQGGILWLCGVLMGMKDPTPIILTQPISLLSDVGIDQ